MIALMILGLSLIAVAIFLLPVMRGWESRAQKQQQTANALNAAVTQYRLAEIEEEAEQSLLDEEQQDKVRAEQKSALAFDAKQEQQTKPIGLKFYIPGILVIFAVSGFYFSRDNIDQLDHWWQSQEKLKDYAARAVEQKGEPLNIQEMQEFALGLRTRLGKGDGDPIGWLLLGRVLMGLNDVQGAIDAFERSYLMRPDNPSLLTDYAQALLFTQDEGLKFKANQLVNQALKLDPSNIAGLGLFALLAQDRGDQQTALQAWQLLLQVLPQDDPRYQDISNEIARLSSTPDDSLAGPQISVTITLSDSFINRVPKKGYLILFAKEFQGKPMPLAVIRQPLGNFPVQLTLSDKNSMVEGLNLSSAKQISVFARISTDQDVSASPGDLQGSVENITVATTDSLSIEIDEIL